MTVITTKLLKRPGQERWVRTQSPDPSVAVVYRVVTQRFHDNLCHVIASLVCCVTKGDCALWNAVEVHNQLLNGLVTQRREWARCMTRSNKVLAGSQTGYCRHHKDFFLNPPHHTTPHPSTDLPGHLRIKNFRLKCHASSAKLLISQKCAKQFKRDSRDSWFDERESLKFSSDIDILFLDGNRAKTRFQSSWYSEAVTSVFVSRPGTEL